MGISMSKNVCEEYKNIKSLSNTSDEFFTPGRKIRVIRNENYVKSVQDKWNGWDNSMLKCLNNVYEVIRIDADGSIILRGSKKSEWLFHRAALEPIEEDLELHENFIIQPKNIPEKCKPSLKFWKSQSEGSLPQNEKFYFPYSVGDTVTLSNDEKKFKELQKYVGGYAKHKMGLILGNTVTIKYICPKFIMVDWKDEDYDIHPDLIIRDFDPIEIINGNNFPEQFEISKKNNEIFEFPKSEDNSEIESREINFEKNQQNNVLDDLKQLFECIELGDHWNLDKILNPDLLNVKGIQGMTPINYSCCKGKLEILKDLLKFGADSDIPDNYGRFPIHNAVKFNHEDVLRFLLTFENDLIRKLTTDSKTSLHIAVIENHKNIMKILLDADVNIFILDNEGKTAFQYANDSDPNPSIDIKEPKRTMFTRNEQSTMEFFDSELVLIKAIQEIFPQIIQETPEKEIQETSALSSTTVQNECEICKFRQKDTTFLECGHTSCSECSKQITICHMCKAPIIKRFKVYI